MEILSERAFASLVMMIGMVVAVVNLRKHPGPSTMLLLATICLLVPTIGSAYAYASLFQYYGEMDAQEHLGYRRLIVGLTVLFRTTGMALLIAAVYYRRPPPRSRKRTMMAESDATPVTALDESQRP